MRSRTKSQSICSRSERASSRTDDRSGSCSLSASSFVVSTSPSEATSIRCAATSISLGPVEVALVDLAAGRAEDQVDQRLAVPGLQQPVLGRPFRLHPRGVERRQRALGVLLADEEVDVVLGRRPAASPGGEPAAEDVRHLGVAQRSRGALHRVEQLGKVLRRA